MNNYFKSGKVIVCFDDTSVADTNAAFEKICEQAGFAGMSVWKMPKHSGSWDGVGIVGHRARKEILDDIQIATTEHIDSDNKAISASNLMFFRNELATRDTAAGRVSYPS